MDRTYNAPQASERTVAHTVFESVVAVLVLFALMLVLREIVSTSSPRVVRVDHATFIGFAVR